MNNIIKILLIPLTYPSLFPSLLYAQWIAQYPNTPGVALHDIEFMNENTGWAVGGASKILFTETGGSITGIQTISTEIPLSFELKQNYPNPFNTATTIEFSIGGSGNYKMEIYNSLGQKIKEVFNEFKHPGKYKINYDASGLSSGVYFYILKFDTRQLIKSFILVK